MSIYNQPLDEQFVFGIDVVLKEGIVLPQGTDAKPYLIINESKEVTDAKRTIDKV